MRAVEGPVDGFGDAVQAFLLGDLFEVAPRVEVEPVEPQLLAAEHLVVERRARLFEPLGFGMPEVDEVGIVRQYLRRGVAVFFAGTAECGALRVGERFGHPLALVLGEKGQRRGSDGAGIGRGVPYAARGAYVGSEEFHSCEVKG